MKIMKNEILRVKTLISQSYKLKIQLPLKKRQCGEWNDR